MSAQGMALGPSTHNTNQPCKGGTKRGATRHASIHFQGGRPHCLLDERTPAVAAAPGTARRTFLITAAGRCRSEKLISVIMTVDVSRFGM